MKRKIQSPLGRGASRIRSRDLAAKKRRFERENPLSECERCWRVERLTSMDGRICADCASELMPMFMRRVAP